MSVQFGRWNFDGAAPSGEEIQRASRLLVPYGTDGASCYSQDSVAIVHRAFHTTKETRGEAQPHVSRSGAVVTWDGRLDNRLELMDKLKNGLNTDSSDASIVAAAHDEWATGCFARLIGDWALSLWSPTEERK